MDQKVVFVKVVSTKNLEPGKMMGAEAGGKEIFIANLGDKYFAMGNRCTHMGCMLSDGELQGENVRCICHGSVFDIRTGKVVKGPAKKADPVYPVKVEEEQVLIDVYAADDVG